MFYGQHPFRQRLTGARTDNVCAQDSIGFIDDYFDYAGCVAFTYRAVQLRVRKYMLVDPGIIGDTTRLTKCHSNSGNFRIAKRNPRQ